METLVVRVKSGPINANKWTWKPKTIKNYTRLSLCQGNLTIIIIRKLKRSWVEIKSKELKVSISWHISQPNVILEREKEVWWITYDRTWKNCEWWSNLSI